jgi:glucose uptake protein
VYTPELYGTALFMMIIGMFCWGSWVTVHRRTKNWRFELFYWDLVLGILLCALLVGVTLGRTDPTSPDSFFQNLSSARASAVLFGMISGALWNVGNYVFFASIILTGMAVAFPLTIGLAIVIGSILNYILKPMGNPWLLFGGLAMMIIAIVLDGLAYKKRSQGQVVSSKGIVLACAGGVLMGLFYPFVVKATTGDGHLGPYTVGLIFGLGVAISIIPLNFLFMRRPVQGEPLTMRDYFAGSAKDHFWGIVSGMVFQIGTVLNYVVAYAKMVGPAVSYVMGQGSSMVGASWGVFVFKEFKGASRQVVLLLVLMFFFFLAGLTAVALAPLVH